MLRKLTLSFAFAVCAYTYSFNVNAAPIRVVATIPPIHSMVAMVLDGIATPKLIVEGYASPHDYAMSPSDASDIAQADIIFWFGPGLEGFLIKSIENLDTRTRVVTLDSDAKPQEKHTEDAHKHSHKHEHEHEHEHHGEDPHFWLDPEKVEHAIEKIAASLAALLPAHQKQIDTNLKKALSELAILETDIKKIVAPIKDKEAVVLHDAYGQFTAHFGLKPFIPLSVTPDHRPGPAKLRKIRQLIKEHSIGCVFREPQYPKRYTALLIEGSTAREGTLDPLGGGLTPGPDLYGKLLRTLATSLRDCLSP